MIGLWKSLGVTKKGPVSLKCDSQSALYIIENPVFHDSAKHIEVDCHFVRDVILKKLIAPSYVPTTDQLEDVHTKSLGVNQFKYLLAKIDLRNLYAPS